MKFTTKISGNTEEGHHIHGESIAALMKERTFTETIFLLYAGRLPLEGERMLLDAVLVASAEHGIEVPSLYVPRVSVSSGNPVHVGIAAGVLALGESHGGAGRAAAELLLRSEDAGALVQEYAATGKFMPGFGHPVYKEEDPRARLIYEKAARAGISMEYFEKAHAIESALERSAGKKLPLNIDGACAAATLSLSLPPAAAEALFVVGRVAGMGAHATEELEQKNGYHRLEPGDITR